MYLFIGRKRRLNDLIPTVSLKHLDLNPPKIIEKNIEVKVDNILKYYIFAIAISFLVFLP
jgi:hypothetical protein